MIVDCGLWENKYGSVVFYIRRERQEDKKAQKKKQ